MSQKKKNNIGIKSPDTMENKTKVEDIKKQPPKEIFVDFKKEAVTKELKSQISVLISGRNNYKTLNKLAATYLLTARQFRDKCLNDDELAQLLQIYNSVYLEHIMDRAIQTGKVNTQTESYLRDELQAFTGSGFEQNIKWNLDKGDLVDIDGNKFELNVDVNRKQENEAPLWEQIDREEELDEDDTE